MKRTWLLREPQVLPFVPEYLLLKWSNHSSSACTLFWNQCAASSSTAFNLLWNTHLAGLEQSKNSRQKFALVRKQKITF